MKRKLISLLSLSLGLMLVLTGCGAPPTNDLMANVKAAEQSAAPSEPDIAYIDSVGDFSWQLLQQTVKKDGNVLVSPASVYLALAMTLNGADSTTREAMLEVLSAQGLTVEQINAASRDWMALLMNTGNKTRLTVANSIWYRDGFDPDPAFLQNNADYYAAAAKTLDFSLPTAKDTINAWVKSSTNGLIDTIIDEIDPRDIMYLINAVYFKAQWMSEFYANSTADGTFGAPSGDKTVKFMHQTSSFDYLSNNNGEGLLMPYSDGRFAFVAILPTAGMSVRELVAATDAASFAELLKTRETMSIELSLPKFETRFDTSLKDSLTAMGMAAAFDPGVADFSLMNSGRRQDLYIDEVLHKTFCRVDEMGTEAAAVTAVISRGTSMPVSNKQLVFDRPFVYGIVDTATGLPLFLGIMDDPSAE